MAFKVGAHGYVCKSEHYNVLKDAIEAIVKGTHFLRNEWPQKYSTNAGFLLVK